MPYILIFIIISNIDITVVESIGLAQVEGTVAGTRIEDNAVQTSTSEPSAVEFVAAPVAVKATTIMVLEVSG